MYIVAIELLMNRYLLQNDRNQPQGIVRIELHGWAREERCVEHMIHITVECDWFTASIKSDSDDNRKVQILQVIHSYSS